MAIGVVTPHKDLHQYVAVAVTAASLCQHRLRKTDEEAESEAYQEQR